ncbi:hypothetical protein V6N13_147479 [Hibiscus sabdariffa]
MASSGKKTKGKQKIEMKLIEKEDDKRFLDNNILPSDDNTRHLVESHLKERINNIIQQYNEINRQMDASKEKEEALAQQTSERDANLWWETPPYQINPQELEEHDSRYAELLNVLYRIRSRKLAGTTVMPTPRDPAQLNPLPTNPNEDVNAAFQSGSSRGPQD